MRSARSQKQGRNTLGTRETTNPAEWVAFQTCAGWMEIAFSSRGLTAVILPLSDSDRIEEHFSYKKCRLPVPDARLADIRGRFEAYFSGRPVDFPDEVDLSAHTPFQQKVWQALRMIPRGQTRSYQWVANTIGMPSAARAVGQAVGRNPLPIVIPCHRVIAADGGIGGFTGGLVLKRRLLMLEGITI